MENSLASNRSHKGGEGRSVLWGEEHQIKDEVAFVIGLSKPGDSVFDSQTKLKVGSCLPISEEGDWGRTSLLCFENPFPRPENQCHTFPLGKAHWNALT